MSLTKTQHHGQSLIELVMAIGIILVSTLATITLIISTITVGRESQTKVEAANFAREGVEVIRSLRDSNWLRADNNIADGADQMQWDDTGLTAGHVGMNGAYSLKLDPVTGWALQPGGDTVIYRHVNGQFFSQDNCGALCEATIYHRTVTVTPQIGVDQGNFNGALKPIDYLNIVSTVTWTDRVGNHTLTAKDRLYNWK